MPERRSVREARERLGETLGVQRAVRYLSLETQTPAVPAVVYGLVEHNLAILAACAAYEVAINGPVVVFNVLANQRVREAEERLEAAKLGKKIDTTQTVDSTGQNTTPPRPSRPAAMDIPDRRRRLAEYRRRPAEVVPDTARNGRQATEPAVVSRSSPDTQFSTLSERRPVDITFPLTRDILPWLRSRTTVNVPLEELAVNGSGNRFLLGKMIGGSVLEDAAAVLGERGQGMVDSLFDAHIPHFITEGKAERVAVPRTDSPIYHFGNKLGLRVYFMKFGRPEVTDLPIILRVAECAKPQQKKVLCTLTHSKHTRLKKSP